MSLAATSSASVARAPLRGRLRLPGRQVDLAPRAALRRARDGTSPITNLATGDDVRATARVLDAARRARSRTDGDAVVGAAARASTAGASPRPCSTAGTAARRCGCCRGVLAGRPFLSVLTGDASLRPRPMGRVVGAAAGDGCAHRRSRRRDARAARDPRRASARRAPRAAGRERAGEDGAVARRAAGRRGDRDRVAGAEPRPHASGCWPRSVRRSTSTACSVRVSGGAPQPFELDVPGDPSSAAFFVVAAADHARLRHRASKSVSCNPTRLGFVDGAAPDGRRHRARADAARSAASRSASCGCGRRRCTATTIAGDEIPNVIDEIPALAVAAAFAEGVTEIRDAAELVVKESNRIGTLHEELAQLGVARRGPARRAGRSAAGTPRRGVVREPRRPSHRHGAGGGRQRDRRRESTVARLAGGRRRRTRSSRDDLARLDRAGRNAIGDRGRRDRRSVGLGQVDGRARGRRRARPAGARHRGDVPRGDAGGARGEGARSTTQPRARRIAREQRDHRRGRRDARSTAAT